MIEAALELGSEPPDELLPKEIEMVTEPAAPYWVAFHVLSGARQYLVGLAGAHPLPIPYSEISAYAKDNGWADTLSELQDFVEVIRAVDDAYVKSVVNEELKRKEKRQKAKA